MCDCALGIFIFAAATKQHPSAKLDQPRVFSECLWTLSNLECKMQNYSSDFGGLLGLAGFVSSLRPVFVSLF